MPRETIGAMFLRVLRRNGVPDGSGIVIITPDVLERWCTDDLEPPTETPQGWRWYPKDCPGIQIIVQARDDIDRVQFAQHMGSMSGADSWRSSEPGRED